MEGLVNSIEYYLSKFINATDVYLIFDRYFENSIKSDIITGTNWDISMQSQTCNQNTTANKRDLGQSIQEWIKFVEDSLKKFWRGMVCFHLIGLFAQKYLGLCIFQENRCR